jgi:hypothetical protein
MNALPLHSIDPCSWREYSPDLRQHCDSAGTKAASKSHTMSADVQNTCKILKKFSMKALYHT